MKEEEAAAHFTPIELEVLEKYQFYLIKWNKKFSFTSIPDEEIFVRLIAPSAWLGKMYSQEDIGLVADFGSGPGIPGLVMALVDSNNEYLLIESSGKKAGFMKNVVSSLSLGNVKVLGKRFTPSSQIEQVDRIVSRAAGEISEVLQLFSGKTRAGASADFFKGSDAEEEVRKAEALLPRVKTSYRDVPAWFEGLKIVRVENI